MGRGDPQQTIFLRKKGNELETVVKCWRFFGSPGFLLLSFGRAVYTPRNDKIIICHSCPFIKAGPQGSFW